MRRHPPQADALHHLGVAAKVLLVVSVQALPVAAEELAQMAELCDEHAPNTLLTVARELTEAGVREAYRVIDGKVGAPVKGATLIGDGATSLKHIRALGNDMALDPGMGNCGKDGQWVPVGVGQPTVLMDGLTVGGSAAG